MGLIGDLVRHVCASVSRRLPLRVIPRGWDDSQPYLARYYVCGRVAPSQGAATPVLGWLPITVYLHHFLTGDVDEELHNHPWGTSLSLILAGGYREERRRMSQSMIEPHTRYDVISHEVRPGRFNVIRKDDFHRVDMLDGDCWSLFFAGTVEQSWGFWNRRTLEFWNHKEHYARKIGQAHVAASRRHGSPGK